MYSIYKYPHIVDLGFPCIQRLCFLALRIISTFLTVTDVKEH